MDYLEWHAARCGLPKDHWKRKSERRPVERDNNPSPETKIKKERIILSPLNKEG